MATPVHDVETFTFDHGSYAEFEFALYDYDNTVFAVGATDRSYVKIGENGLVYTMKITQTGTTGGSVTVLTTGSTGVITLKITATDSLNTLNATTYDFQVYLLDKTDDEIKYFARGKFDVKTTIL